MVGNNDNKISESTKDKSDKHEDAGIFSECRMIIMQ